MRNYQLIQESSLINQGDRIRRPLGNGKYDEMIVGEYLNDLDAYEVNLPGKPRIIDAISLLPYISKENMIAQKYEILVE
jgi:hypothetical protein